MSDVFTDGRRFLQNAGHVGAKEALGTEESRR